MNPEDHVQYRNVLSVSILAKISPRGSAAMIRMAAANQDAAVERDMIQDYKILCRDTVPAP